jgi:hypothetical protein
MWQSSGYVWVPGKFICNQKYTDHTWKGGNFGPPPSLEIYFETVCELWDFVERYGEADSCLDNANFFL